MANFWQLFLTLSFPIKLTGLHELYDHCWWKHNSLHFCTDDVKIWRCKKVSNLYRVFAQSWQLSLCVICLHIMSWRVTSVLDIWPVVTIALCPVSMHSTDIYQRSQTSYTTLRNGVISHGAQFGVFGFHAKPNAQTMCPQSLRTMWCFTLVLYSCPDCSTCSDICTWWRKNPKTPNLSPMPRQRWCRFWYLQCISVMHSHLWGLWQCSFSSLSLNSIYHAFVPSYETQCLPNLLYPIQNLLKLKFWGYGLTFDTKRKLLPVAPWGWECYHHKGL